MKRLLISASLAVTALVPVAAQAQAIPPAIVAVVDLERVTSQCNACKTASASLQSQLTALQTRQQSLAGPLNTEGQSIQTAVNALKGKEPDAALKARAQAWDTKRQQAGQEIQRQEQQLKANSDYVQKQILEKLAPIYSQVMQRRGANMLVEQNATLASGSALDVSNDVLAALNASLPSIQTSAPVTTQNRSQGR
jgi:Skp family chaperone for outer membrane proteins